MLDKYWFFINVFIVFYGKFLEQKKWLKQKYYVDFKLSPKNIFKNVIPTGI